MKIAIIVAVGVLFLFAVVWVIGFLKKRARMQHYIFAHQLLPAQMFADPSTVLVPMVSETGYSGEGRVRFLASQSTLRSFHLPTHLIELGQEERADAYLRDGRAEAIRYDDQSSVHQADGLVQNSVANDENPLIWTFRRHFVRAWMLQKGSIIMKLVTRQRAFGFLRRVFLSDYGPPPPPNTAVLPSFPGERMVEVIYSESKRERVFITVVDQSGLYKIYVQCWDDSDWKDWGQAFWTHASSTGGRTDSIDTARGIAAEELRCW
jgi:hypothetical protein